MDELNIKLPKLIVLDEVYNLRGVQVSDTHDGNRMSFEKDSNETAIMMMLRKTLLQLHLELIVSSHLTHLIQDKILLFWKLIMMKEIQLTLPTD